MTEGGTLGSNPLIQGFYPLEARLY
jgi:hypothetical protein